MTIYPDRLSPNQDDVYNALTNAHEGLSEADSHALNARLVLLMANQIGDASFRAITGTGSTGSWDG